jgi:hypothetical protein
MISKPIERNENLKWLTKEHHYGLVATWKINQGIEMRIATGRIKKYIFFFWENYLNQHFAEEEILIFTKKNDPKISEALQQHDNIRTVIKKLQSGVTYEFMLMQQFAEKLETPIRYEERILLPHFGKILTSKELKSIGIALEKSHPVTIKANYADDFFGYYLNKVNNELN